MSLSALLRVFSALLLACALVPSAHSETAVHGFIVLDESLSPPADDSAWEPVSLPDNWRQSRPGKVRAAAWYRMEFQISPAELEDTAHIVYIPYLYGGGRIFLNGRLLDRIKESDAREVVRWERPHWIAVPTGLLHLGRNALEIRRPAASLRFPRVSLGARDELLPQYERRLLWVNTFPQVTAVVCVLMSVFLLFIWWRRPKETIYGFLGIASLMWGVRTMTFVIERIPVDLYVEWRVIYHCATGGFAVMMGFFAMRFAGVRYRWVEYTLIGYWLVGPLIMARGASMDELVGRIWAAGLIPVALMVLFFIARAALQQRSWQAFALLAAIALAVLAGVHDYLISWGETIAASVAPTWVGHRVFLLHHAANLLLLTTVSVLVARFAETLDAVEELNESLEHRVADREQQLERNFEVLSELKQQRAVQEERQRFMRDMHDGLGSQLLTSLSRVERQKLDQQELIEVLRDCIGEMRLALYAISPLDDDFQAGFGNFRYRWEQQLSAEGIVSVWNLAALSEAHTLPSRCRIHVLRVLQEALTNVIKHADADSVQVRVAATKTALSLEVFDNGCGIASNSYRGGRGLENMRVRARDIGAEIAIGALHPHGTCVRLTVPLPGETNPSRSTGHTARAG